MSKLVERNDVVYSQCTFQIPNSIKIKAQELGVNLTQAAIAGIEEAVENAESGKA